ncbi:hypothetical protein RHMOL_Rhmol03G0059700 [Rhododendron molle]|uniref:Uncharacterized protein n=2 Tax=Rhododendron molle TaxID=49168 RepID=A0ACC0PC57_RHOML|nr:hypothetical protein RHMOL_Rhmol11G0204900 [Rhododendron molle]KAI8562756.1 hypothetical protein RHMOL_Rhmol03G0059700 [Rhododendron molle]
MDLPNLSPENPFLSATPSLLISTPLFSPSPTSFPRISDLSCFVVLGVCNMWDIMLGVCWD